jgi:aquaporin Z
MLNVLSTLFRATAMSNTKKWSAEFLGTFWLTLGGAAPRCWRRHFRPHRPAGCIAGLRPDGGDRCLCVRPGVGGHFNPAVSVGLVIGKRFSASELPGYIISQVLGAIAAAGVLYLIVSARLASAAWADSPRTATVPIAGRLQPAVGAGAKSS